MLFQTEKPEKLVIKFVWPYLYRDRALGVQ